MFDGITGKARLDSVVWSSHDVLYGWQIFDASAIFDNEDRMTVSPVCSLSSALLLSGASSVQISQVFDATFFAAAP